MDFTGVSNETPNRLMATPEIGSFPMDTAAGDHVQTVMGCLLVDRICKELAEMKSLFISKDLLLKDAHDSLERTKPREATQQAQINALTEEVQALTTKSLEMVAKQDTACLLEATLRTKIAEISAFTIRVATLEREVKEVKEQNDKLVTASGSVTAGNKTLLAENCRLRNENSSIAKELESSQQQKQRELVSNKQLRDQVQSGQQELIDARKGFTKRVASLEEVEARSRDEVHRWKRARKEPRGRRTSQSMRSYLQGRNLQLNMRTARISFQSRALEIIHSNSDWRWLKDW